MNPKVAKPVIIDVSPKQDTQAKPVTDAQPVAQKLSLLPDANYNSENEIMSESEPSVKADSPADEIELTLE